MPPIVYALAFVLVFVGFLIYPFTGSRGTNMLAGLILLGYVGAKTVLREPLWKLQGWLVPRERLKNGLLAAGAIIFFLGLIEMAGQIATRTGMVEPYSAMRTQLPKGVGDFRKFHITADKYREYDPELLWRPVDEWPYNRQRMKGPVAEMPKPAGIVRIMSFGDSNTDGPNENTWSERLQGLLNARYAEHEYEVINAGVAGYSSHQGLLRFHRTVDDFQPDLIFVSYGWNDAAPSVNGSDKEYRQPAAWIASIERFLIKFPSVRAIKTLQVPSKEERPSELDFPPRVSLEDYRANLQSFLELARASSVVPVFLTRPHIYERERARRATNMRGRVPDYNDTLLQFASDTGAPMIDVRRHFGAEARDLSELFIDDCHFSSDGSQDMAEFLLRRLTEMALLPAPRWTDVK